MNKYIFILLVALFLTPLSIAAVTCTTDADCAVDEVCVKHVCTPKEVAPPTSPEKKACIVDEQCTDDEYCANGFCTKVTGICGYAEDHKWIAYECCADADCAEGQECKDHKCIGIPKAILSKDADDAIAAAEDEINVAKTLGKDVSAAEKKLNEAKKAYTNENYEEAKSLAKKAKELAAAAPLIEVAKEKKSVVKPQPKKDDYNWLILTAIAIIAIPTSYYLILRKI